MAKYIKKIASVIIIKNHIFLIVLVSTLIVACEDNTLAMHESQFNIYALLRNDKLKQEVIVDRTYSMEEPSELYVDDALVILSGPTTTDTLVFSDIRLRYVTSDTFPMQPLQIYRVTVIKEEFDTLFAETKIPGDFDFIFPSEEDTMTLADTIIFKRNIGAFLYYCNFRTVLSNNTWVGQFYYEPVASDTVIKIPLCDYFMNYPSGLYTIWFAALDTNFYQYYYEPEDSLIQAGVENGFGLFGSAWVDTIFNYIITE